MPRRPAPTLERNPAARRAPVQAKLKVGLVADRHEQEANRVAARIGSAAPATAVSPPPTISALSVTPGPATRADGIHVGQSDQGRSPSQMASAHGAAGATAGRIFASVSARAAPATPEELAVKALTAGPKDTKEKAAFEKVEKAAAKVEKSGTPISRVEIPAAGTHAGVKGVTSSEFASEASKSGHIRRETGLPKAFLRVSSVMAPANVAPDDAATIDTNVRVAFKKSSSGGSVWVVSASLPWILDTAGFLDIESIDPKMLKPYQSHEKGHSTIAQQIRDRLAKLMQVELEGALPTEQKPLTKSGKRWDQEGVDAIIAKIEGIQQRYQKWFDELAAAADAEWDAQEKQTLSKIAAAIKATGHKPGSSVPKVPGEE
jgi:hypothetical protein